MPNSKPDTILVRDLCLNMLIGINADEQNRQQDVIVNLSIDMSPINDQRREHISQTICYDTLISQIQSLPQKKHYKLVEDFAEDIAKTALSHHLAQQVTVCVEKPQAIADARAVGIEIIRYKS